MGSSFTLQAQDILVFKNGEVENVKVIEVNPAEIKYKKSSNPDGPTFIEKRSNIYSIKYQNGEVQNMTTTEKSKKNIPSRPSAYKDLSNFTNEIELYIGNLWGIGYQLRKDLNPYISWDIVGVSYISRFESPASIGLVNFRPLGIRFHTPAYGTIRGYAGLKLGYSYGYQKDSYTVITAYSGYEHLEKHTFFYKEHLFGLDFCTGIQFHKNIAVGYNLNFITNNEVKLLNHMAMISFIF